MPTTFVRSAVPPLPRRLTLAALMCLIAILWSAPPDAHAAACVLGPATADYIHDVVYDLRIAGTTPFDILRTVRQITGVSFTIAQLADCGIIL